MREFQDRDDNMNVCSKKRFKPKCQIQRWMQHATNLSMWEWMNIIKTGMALSGRDLTYEGKNVYLFFFGCDRIGQSNNITNEHTYICVKLRIHAILIGFNLQRLTHHLYQLSHFFRDTFNSCTSNRKNKTHFSTYSYNKIKQILASKCRRKFALHLIW